MSDEKGTRLRFEPSLSWGDLLLAGSLLVAGVVAFQNLDTRITINDERINNVGNGASSLHNELQSHITSEDARRETMRQELRSELHDINAKLDRLIEGGERK